LTVKKARTSFAFFFSPRLGLTRTGVHAWRPTHGDPQFLEGDLDGDLLPASDLGSVAVLGKGKASPPGVSAVAGFDV